MNNNFKELDIQHSNNINTNIIKDLKNLLKFNDIIITNKAAYHLIFINEKIQTKHINNEYIITYQLRYKIIGPNNKLLLKDFIEIQRNEIYNNLIADEQYNDEFKNEIIHDLLQKVLLQLNIIIKLHEDQLKSKNKIIN